MNLLIPFNIQLGVFYIQIFTDLCFRQMIKRQKQKGIVRKRSEIRWVPYLIIFSMDISTLRYKKLNNVQAPIAACIVKRGDTLT